MSAVKSKHAERGAIGEYTNSHQLESLSHQPQNMENMENMESGYPYPSEGNRKMTTFEEFEEKVYTPK